MARHARVGQEVVDNALAALLVEVETGRLSHANPNVTMSVYGHFLPETDRAAAELLDGLLDDTGDG